LIPTGPFGAPSPFQRAAMKSFALPVGTTVEEMSAAMGHQPPAPPEAPEPPKRARVKGGRFRADDPATPETDEAWQSEN
jgi:hypothetical protein